MCMEMYGSGAGTGGRTIQRARKQTMQVQKLVRTGWYVAVAGTITRGPAGQRVAATTPPAIAATFSGFDS